MTILGKILATFAFIFGIIALYFPGGFGLLHFRKGKPKAVSLMASSLWVAFMLAHVLAIYRIWFSGDIIYPWLAALLLAQVVFFTTIARDVSTQ